MCASRRRVENRHVDAVAIAIGVAMFLILLAFIEGLDRV
jgi:hypothetical protein